jgi:hypothetical protein
MEIDRMIRRLQKAFDDGFGSLVDQLLYTRFRDLLC